MKKGFTTVELVVSFALTGIMLLLLFELVISIRSLYLSSGLKTELLTKQALMTSKINSDLSDYIVTGVNECGANCFDIYYEGGAVKRLSLDTTNGVFRYDSYATNLIHDSFFKTATVSFDVVYNAPLDQYDSYFTLRVPIAHKLYKDDDFGVSATYIYDSRVNPVVIGIP